MAKILETLKAVEGRRGPAEAQSEPPRPAIKLVVEEELEESYPYIEVGGADRQVEGSADVMGAPRPRPVNSQPACPAGTLAEPVLIYQPLSSQQAVPELAPELVVLHDPDGPLAGQYAGVIRQLLESEESPRSLLFTSLSAHDGVTCTALNLALAAALRHDKMVAVVDFNIYRPEVARWLGVADHPGLQDVLVGSAALEQATHPTAVPGLYALPTDATPLTEMGWTVDAIRWVVAWLGRRYDLVFLLAPAWEGGSHLEALAGTVDSVFPVLTHAENNTPAMQQLLPSITRAGGQVRGLFFTAPVPA